MYAQQPLSGESEQKFVDPITGQEISKEDYKDLLKKQQMLLSQHTRSFVSHSATFRKMQNSAKNKVIAYMQQGFSLTEAKDKVLQKMNSNRRNKAMDSDRL